MIFLSALLQRSVYDHEDHRVGNLRDVCVSLDETFPVITALVVQPLLGSDKIIIPWSHVRSIEENPVTLTTTKAQLTPYEPTNNELLLKRDILDKQIVDTQGFRVVKVNDLKLAQIKRTARLVGVDISLSGLLRRLGWQRAIDMIGRITPLQLEERTVTWNYVEPIQVVSQNTGQLAAVGVGGTQHVGAAGVVPQVQLNVSHNKLADLHPADIADILEQLDLDEAGAVLERLDDETAADTLNEVEYPRQSELLEELGPERASDLLERLAPDDAADILADMSTEDAERLLNLMPSVESQPIRDLLRYDAQTAGGIMTTEILKQPQSAAATEVLEYLRQHSSHLDMVYYLYIVDEEQHLIGVVSLRQLITASPDAQMDTLMDQDVIKVLVTDDQEKVARVIAKYDLLSVPVVDDENHLLGIVTVDDVIDVMQEEQAEDISEMTGTDVEASNEEEGSWIRNTLSRSSWLLVSVVAGFIISLMLTSIFSPLLRGTTAFVSLTGETSALTSSSAYLSLLFLLPMLMLTTGTAGSQALGIAGWELRTERGQDFLKRIGRELLYGTTGGVLSIIVVGILAWFLFHSLPLSLIVGLSFGVTLLVTALCGISLPNLLQRLNLRGSLISAPLLDPVIMLISIAVFLTISLTLLHQFIP